MIHQYPTEIGAGAFKSQCLKLLDAVAFTRAPLVITKRGKAVAKLVPCPTKSNFLVPCREVSLLKVTSFRLWKTSGRLRADGLVAGHPCAGVAAGRQ